MRVLVHDYCGHPFQVQLSRGLAAAGHEVLHVFSQSFQSPRGQLQPLPGDPDSFQVRGIQLSRPFDKQRFCSRYVLELEFAQRLVQQCVEFRPDAVLSSNAPSHIQWRLARFCKRNAIRLVTWIQDMYGLAAYRILKRKVPLLGRLIGSHFMSLDRKIARHSDAVVVITEDFVQVVCNWGVDPARIHTVHNWAPLADLPVLPRNNRWTQEQGLTSPLRFLYSGTLAMKHNPDLLLQLARKLDQWGGAELVVISEGAAADWLRRQAEQLRTRSLLQRDFQPFERMAEVFASADVLLTILEPDAGVFCVPSKVLSYMCAQRAQLLAVPGDNLAARTIKNCQAGLAVEPNDLDAFLAAARRLYNDAPLRHSCGAAGRAYAEEHFNFQNICSQFSHVLGCKKSESLSHHDPATI